MIVSVLVLYRAVISTFAGILKYSDVIESDSAMLRLMFSVYMVAGNFILLNLFIAVINEGLSFLYNNPEEADFDIELSNYLTVSISTTSKRGRIESFC